jgi:DNA-binding NarL/FixJ family response regulator
MPSEPTPARPVRVLIVDDHDLFRTGLRELLYQEGFEVADSVSGEAAVRRVGSFAPDVVVMDMNMPGMSGVEATRLVLEQAPATRVLMLTVASEEDAVLDAIRAGASGYLLKDAELSHIVAGIRHTAVGESAIAPGVAGALVTRVRRGGESEDDSLGDAAPLLSERERDVLRLLTEGCENAEIAARLHLSPSTIKTHVSQLFDKLGVDNRVQAAVVAVRLRLVDEVSRDDSA